jgi:hypothetical protein
MNASFAAFRVLVSLITVLCAGCAAKIYERHYLPSYAQSDSRKVGDPVNFFRLTVDGSASFTNARYLSGFFDERAVDLFFNEMKAPTNQKLFDESIKPPGHSANEAFKPLSPSTEGAFVLILSTNADSIANAIGSFAESQVVADALTRAFNKDKFAARAQSDVEVSTLTARAQLATERVKLGLDSARAATSDAAARTAYQRSLLALAQALGYRGAEFKDFADARRWFELEATVGGAK